MINSGECMNSGKCVTCEHIDLSIRSFVSKLSNSVN